MDNVIKRRSAKSGLPPGTLVHIGEKSDREIRVAILDYNEAGCEERGITALKDSFYYMDSGSVTWIDVQGLHEVEIIKEFGEKGVHPLVLEDIVNTDQRPKLEDFGDYLYVVLKMLRPQEGKHFRVEQISLILGSYFVISFQEGIGPDIFGHVKERIKNGKGRIRSLGADYLAYALIDPVVDNYFTILEDIGERVERLEDTVITNPAPETMRRIQHLKRELIVLRKAAWPLREVIAAMERRDSQLISDQVAVYLRDVYDHTIQIMDAVEAYRDMLAGMLDIYLSSLSNRMNEVIKFLTIIGTIFIPLTFIAGLYGMNFNNMPELRWHYGYYASLALMGGVAGGMLLYFKRKRWL
jgi:magnesium transporter